MSNIGNDVNQIKISSLSRIQGQPDVVDLLQVIPPEMTAAKWKYRKLIGQKELRD